jgi:uncharacterized protein YdaL
MASAAHMAIVSLGVIARPEQHFNFMVFLHQATWTFCHVSLTYLIDSTLDVKDTLHKVAITFLHAAGIHLIWLT